MPLLQISTNVRIENTTSLTSEASALVADMLGKPESYVMVMVNPGMNMMFAGSNERCAHLKLKSLSLPEDRTNEFSEKLCGFMQQKLNIPTARTYIEFAGPPRHLWGWDNTTF